MYIAIKSEVDSRVLLYPLMRTLKSFGSLIVITSNRQLSRLFEDGESNFRNIEIIIDESGATDDIYQEHGIAPGDYDFVVLDNMGITNYDIYMIALGGTSSLDFADEVQAVRNEGADNTVIFQFGKITSKAKSKKDGSVSQKKEERKNNCSKDYNPTDKFDEKAGISQKKDIKQFQLPFPSFQDIERVEAEHLFYEVDKKMIDAFFDVLSGTLHIVKGEFSKEVRKKDESCNHFSRDAAG